MPRAYWLMKSEPDVFSFADQQAAPGGVGPWEGVRNYQARNFMRAMKLGDLAIFYHSNATPPHAAGIVEIVREAYPDDTQYDPTSPYYDPRVPPAAPRWDRVDVRAVAPLTPVPLDAMRGNPALATLRILQKGNRLSVTPLTEDEFHEIARMGGAPPA